MSRIERHRAVNDLLKSELDGGLARHGRGGISPGRTHPLVRRRVLAVPDTERLETALL
jgi:hypothetical protein